MVNVLNENSRLVQDLTVSDDGRLRVEAMPKYRDLGLLVSGESGQSGYNVAASGIVVGPTTPFTGLDWVRNIMFCVKSTQNYDTGIVRRYSGDDSYVVVLTSQASSASSFTTRAVTQADGSGKNVTGDSCRFYIKNVGASAANMWLAVQVMG